VESTKVHLEGLSREDLNLMISESLCIFPRICTPLSGIIYEKTVGNPFFALEFLKSLVDSRLLKYSLRERRWIWDEAKIKDENITELLSSKMSSLPENMQTALKICSSFGMRVDKYIVDYLSGTKQYSQFRDCLNEAINEGFIHKVGLEFKFVHDKVREAAYGLIPDDKKSQFHYSIGVLLYSFSKEQDFRLGDTMFQICGQINHGIPKLIEPEMKRDIVELNFECGSSAMSRSDHQTAQSYLNNSLLLLSEDHWSSNYEFSLRLYFLSAKAAYSCGKIEKAYDLLKKILREGRCFEEKLDAYYLYATILHTCEESEEAFRTCCYVLKQLNEEIPESIDLKQTALKIRETGAKLANVSDNDLLHLAKGESDSVFVFTLKFYTLLLCISFWKKPELMPFLGCRIIHLSLVHGVCQDSVFGFILYASVLCQQNKFDIDIQEACRVGRMAMSLLKSFDSAKIIPKVNFAYYGFVALHNLPLQICSSNLRKGFEVGISGGESVTIASYNSMHLLRIALLAGENLLSNLKEADYHIEIMTRFRNKLVMPYLQAYRDTISTLIDRGESTSAKVICTEVEEAMASSAVYATRHKETVYLNKLLQSFWLGYSQRCHHYAKKSLEMKLLGRHNKLMILWYAALNSFRGIKNSNGNGSQFVKVRPLYKEAMSALRSAAELSPWNFRNKVHLLEAELYSFERKNHQAKSAYSAAITSSSCSRYIHEQGLACELAGLHYKKIGELETAIELLQKAKDCYKQWGSQLKVESITQQMDRISSSAK